MGMTTADELDLSGCKILLVDDNEQNLELLLAYMEDLGCKLQTARDGREALESVDREPPDLILLDVMMPHMSGFQACKILKSNPATRKIPVVMVTALNEVSDAERAKELEADDFLTKPVNRAELITRVRAMLKVSKLQRQVDTLRDQLRKLSGEA
jgi:CheY-like chemotaxis protein